VLELMLLKLTAGTLVAADVEELNQFMDPADPVERLNLLSYRRADFEAK
jgi:hypothetical protein